jgi:hypothetical protein
MHPIKSTAKSVLEGLGAHWLGRSLYKNRALILMYHGLTPAKTSPDWGQVPADKFEAQMQYLKSHYNVVTLARLLEMMASGRVEPYTATVTFDEGYGSTHKVAYPILKKLGIPATVYLTTGFITPQHDPARYIWSDYISVLLTASGESKLDLRPWGSEEFDISDATQLYRARRRISIHLKALRTEFPEAKSRVEGGRAKRQAPLLRVVMQVEFTPKDKDERVADMVKRVVALAKVHVDLREYENFELHIVRYIPQKNPERIVVQKKISEL